MKDMIKIKENKDWETSVGPRFVLAYNKKVTNEQKKNNSYDILSRLIGKSDVIIELNGSLLSLPPKKRDACAMEFIDSINKLGLEYRRSKVVTPSSPTLLNLLKPVKVEHQVVAAYIPNEVWIKDDTKSLLSFYGAKYLVVKEASNPSDVLDQLQGMEEDEQVNHFRLIAFDAMSLNAMGIFTREYELSNIQGLLGL